MPITIALDAMGGDFGPSIVVAGANFFLKDNFSKEGSCSQVVFKIFGDKDLIKVELEKFPDIKDRFEVIHSGITITNNMKPIEALRHKCDSSLGMAINEVGQGRAEAVVSSANTGAYIALSKVILGSFPFIDRPAIPAVIPNLKGKSIALDLGANLECSAEMLTQFAIMGEALARILLKKDDLTVGLLNVGSEEMKGNATVQATWKMLKNIDNKTHEDKNNFVNYFNFYGFIEGDDIFKGVTDVVVTDGFSGNIALKSVEGVTSLFFKLLEMESKRSLFNKILLLGLIPILKSLKKTIDPRIYNGAVFLGLKKITVKSHGGADAFSFSKAIKVAVQMVQADFVENIEKRLQLLLQVQ